MKSYSERVAAFWSWFRENEEQLADWVGNIQERNPQEVVEFLAGGLNRAIDGCFFETGGGLEINLASEGRPGMMLLTSHLCRNMPEGFKEKWRFSPWKPAFPQGQLGIHGVRVSPEDMLVLPERDEGDVSFSLRFYHEAVCGPDRQIDENTAYHIVFMLMEMALGENICAGFVGRAELAEGREAGMIPLSELGSFMRSSLEAEDRDMPVDYNPCLVYSGYSFEPVEHDAPRYDVIAGFTSFTPLLDEYYGDESSIFQMFQENGAKVAFLAFERMNYEDSKVDLALRNELADRLEAEVLGEAESGEEIGVVLGQAIGVDNCYIDLLLYDEQAFLDNCGKVLRGYDFTVKLYDFLPDAEPVAL